MKKTQLLIILSVVLLAISLVGFSLEIDSHGHYFANGIICGTSIWLMISQVKKLQKQKTEQ